MNAMRSGQPKRSTISATLQGSKSFTNFMPTTEKKTEQSSRKDLCATEQCAVYQGMNSTAENALNFIKNAIASGRTVYISSMTKVTAISPATFARWDKSGHSLFKVAADGNLMMASGKAYGRITSGEMMLVGLSAS